LGLGLLLGIATRPKEVGEARSSGGLGQRLKFVFCAATAGRAGGQDAGVEQEFDVAQGVSSEHVESLA